MDIVCGQQGIVSLTHPGQGASDLDRAGYKNILLDFSVCISSGELETCDDNLLTKYPQGLYEYLKTALEHYGKAGLNVPVAKAPYLYRNAEQKNMQGIMKRIVSECIGICGRIHCKYIIIQPFSSGQTAEERWEVNREYYLYLADRAAECGVTILLVNQCRDNNGHLVRGVCSDEKETAAWVDALNIEIGEERFGFCMDVGICTVCGQNMYDFVCTLGKRIKMVVLRDCDGIWETAMLPFTCVNKGKSQTDWLNLIRGLREIDFDGEVLIDFASTATCFSPLLRPELLRLSKAVGNYFVWQIGMERLMKKYSSIVLFGAGNMCRNYMRCYGKKYPPLFTCDNNARLWDTEFCGLMVRPPECLKELPEECAIFICNIFYREIEGQLRSMGIGNSIEFFNDEYMPVLPFDNEEYS